MNRNQGTIRRAVSRHKGKQGTNQEKRSIYSLINERALIKTEARPGPQSKFLEQKLTPLFNGREEWNS